MGRPKKTDTLTTTTGTTTVSPAIKNVKWNVTSVPPGNVYPINSTSTAPAPVQPVEPDVKPGYKTTEFYITAAVALGLPLVNKWLSAQYSYDQAVDFVNQALGIFVQIATVVAYIWSRTMLKSRP